MTFDSCKEGQTEKGKGPVHILLLSLPLPFASICHRRVLQYPRCLILLLTQGSASTGGRAAVRKRYGTEFRTSKWWNWVLSIFNVEEQAKEMQTNTWFVKKPHQVYCLSARNTSGAHIAWL